MRLPPARVRLRLAAWYVASIAVLVTGYIGVLLALVYQQSVTDVDTSLRLDLSSFVDPYLLGQELPGVSASARSFERSEPGESTVDMWFFDESTAALVAGRRIRGEGLISASPPPFDSARQGVGFDLVVNGVASRVMQASVRSGGRRTVVFQAALSLAPVHAMVRGLARSAVWGLLGLLGLACVSGVLIAGHALAPISNIIRRTRAMRPGDLTARLPVSGPADEVAELSKVINDLLALVQSSLARQARFATEAAHELRTPLTAQRSVGELVLRGQASAADLREAVSSMLEEGEHMQKLIDSLLIIARADGGLLPAATEAIDISALTERCMRSMQPLADAKGQTLLVKTGDACHVFVEETLLRQALLNLIHNAIKHTGNTTHIAIRVQAEADQVRILVMDNGPGFAAIDEEQVIRRVARRPADPGERGLGMGLTIARALVRSQGGRMTVSSQLGLGTVIELRFHIAPAALN